MTRHTRARRRVSVGGVAAQIGAALALVGLLIGIPWALVVLAPISAPQGAPTWDAVWSFLTGPDDATVILGALSMVAWALWGLFTVSTAVDAVGRLRRVRMPTIPLLGWLQRSSAWLLTAAGLFATSASPTASTSVLAGQVAVAVAHEVSGPTPPTAASGISAHLGTTKGAETSLAAQATPAGGGAATVPARVAGPKSTGSTAVAADPDPHPVITVQRGDTLWDLAEAHLGDPFRYTEIVDLNVGRTQPDGHALTDAHWVYPGWQLRLPVDAVGVPTEARPGAQSVPTVAYIVEPGDTLWDIAAEQLGDGSLYPEIVDLNVGVRQPDGTELSDPDLIRPGWRLAMPPTTASPAVTAAEPATAVGPAAPAPTEAPPTTAAGPEPRSVAPRGDQAAPDLTVGVEPRSIAPRDGETEEPPGEWSGFDADPGLTTGLVLGLTAMAAGGVLFELNRRRRRQLRLRRAGERIPLPERGSAAEATERELRRVVEPVTFTQLRVVLEHVAAVRRSEGRLLPRIAAVLVGVEAVELVLTEPDSDAVEPFAAACADRWIAATEDLLQRLDSSAGVQLHADRAASSAYPAMATVGLSGDRVLVLNLEAAGTLHVSGDPDAVASAMRALACELVTSPLTVDAPVMLGPAFAGLAAASDPLRVEGVSAHGLESTAIGASIAGERHTGDGADVLVARSSGDGDPRHPTICVGTVDGRPVPPWSGVALVTDASESEWTLVVGTDGVGRLLPLDLAVRVEGLAADRFSELVSLLARGQREEARDVVVTSDEEIGKVRGSQAPPLPPKVAAELPGQSMESSDLAAESASWRARIELITPAPRVLVLGPPAVVNLPTRTGNDRERRHIELAAFLALNPGASSARLDEVIGRGRRVEPGRRYSTISRLRTWLGTDSEGRQYFPKPERHDEYRLAPEVRTDWDDFRDLAAEGLAKDPPDAERLRAALDLVRGRPFEGVQPGAYDWCEEAAITMVENVVDVAHALAIVRLAKGDYLGARHAAAVGLVADPTSELMVRDSIEAAARAGDLPEVERLADLIKRRVLEDDEASDLEDETLAMLGDLSVRNPG